MILLLINISVHSKIVYMHTTVHSFEKIAIDNGKIKNRFSSKFNKTG